MYSATLNFLRTEILVSEGERRIYRRLKWSTSQKVSWEYSETFSDSGQPRVCGLFNQLVDPDAWFLYGNEKEIPSEFDVSEFDYIDFGDECSDCNSWSPTLPNMKTLFSQTRVCLQKAAILVCCLQKAAIHCIRLTLQNTAKNRFIQIHW